MKAIQEKAFECGMKLMDEYSLSIAYTPALEVAYEAGYKSAFEWTKVEDCLPTHGECLLRHASGLYFTGCWSNIHKCWIDHNGKRIDGITHWRKIEIE